MRSLRGLMKDSLMRNSWYLALASGGTAALGFVFWIIIARLYPTESLGYAATLISAMSLIATISLLGFDVGIIRFWKDKNKNALVGSCWTLSIFTALVAGLGAVLLFSGTKFSFLLEKPLYPFFFILLSASWVAYNLLDSVYIAMRDSGTVLKKQLIFSVIKLILPFALLSLGFFGIFASWTIAGLVAWGAILFSRPIPFRPGLDKALLRSVFGFSVFNYLAMLLNRARELIIPLLVFAALGPSETAYFQVAFNVMVLALLIPKSFAKALLAEASHDGSELKKGLRKTMLFTILSSLAIIVAVFIFGRFLLLLYGPSYASGSLALLKLFSLAGLLSGINEILFTLMRVRFMMRPLLFFHFANAFITLGLCALLIGKWIAWIGVAWAAGELATLALILGYGLSKKVMS